MVLSWVMCNVQGALCQGNGYRKILKPCQKAGCGNLVVLLTERNLEGVEEGTNLLSTFVVKRQRDQVKGP
jgi:hypothetical protein